jgi:hypothetical protein
MAQAPRVSFSMGVKLTIIMVSLWRVDHEALKSSVVSGLAQWHYPFVIRTQLTRDNLLQQATDIKDLQLPMMLPGIRINTGPKDYLPVEQLQLVRFDGERWVRFGDLVGCP